MIRNVSLEEWEERTKLSPIEKQTVIEIQEACLDLPLPSSWYMNKLPASPAHTPIRSNLSTADLLATSTTTSKPLDTLQSFYDWFAVLEQEMDQGDVYRDRLEKVLRYREACHQFLKHLDETRQNLLRLEEEDRLVADKTRTVQADAIVEEQARLTELADGLSERLRCFNQLEQVAKLLNSPRENVCLDHAFIPMLNQLDECIDYMNQHPHYKDSELYSMRFRQYMTRGMTLTKMYIVSTFKNLGQDIYKQLKDPSISVGKQTTTCYVKFKSLIPTLKPLVTQVERRCGHAEYQSLYEEILYSYFQTRHYLFSPIVSRKLQQLESPELLVMVKSVCAYMMQVCTDEFHLYYSMFQAPHEDRLYQYLELLTQQFYTHLWSRINRENDVKILTELCNLFSMYVMQDEHHDYKEERKQLKFGKLIQNLLKDTQGRLFSRS